MSYLSFKSRQRIGDQYVLRKRSLFEVDRIHLHPNITQFPTSSRSNCDLHRTRNYHKIYTSYFLFLSTHCYHKCTFRRGQVKLGNNTCENLKRKHLVKFKILSQWIQWQRTRNSRKTLEQKNSQVKTILIFNSHLRNRDDQQTPNICVD